MNRWTQDIWFTILVLLRASEVTTRSVPGLDVEVKVELLWPLYFVTIPFSSRRKPSLEKHQLGDQLAEIAINGFDKYFKTVLPRELEIDPEFAEEYHSSDFSRNHVAWKRWQKVAFRKHFGVKKTFLDWRGDRVPTHKEISYDWRELYESKAFKVLDAKVSALGKTYLKKAGYEEIPRKLVSFWWAEVYNFGDFHRSRTHMTGAALSGCFFPSVSPNAFKLNVEDPRGINPPYGKTFSSSPESGQLIMFPPWTPHTFTPNMINASQVVYKFVLYFPAGPGELDWQEDATGEMIIKDRVKMTR
eukprot:gnl/MRDRNA2_/MRDRNA2_113354_c0_seq1.p1 gnl/MRDRNA2_/MRDRNA2_113354_c0~~gnl/MRDRNA2_/MRDRNA2_113354_c0_seq1.p1  ORF type:complete len:302 (-),score=57.96 gnl/MRDRNA2_/MRDRNA2_113354_c0_seq1:83-988(-)